MFIGKKIKELRKSQGITLTELSKRSGIQLATLSRIENLKMTGTLESHINIAKSLGIDITQLYTGIIEEDEKPEIRPSGSSNDVFVHSDKSISEILTSKILEKKMMPLLLKIDPNGETSAEKKPEGTEEFIFVLEGAVTAVIKETEYPLSKNNTLYFDASKTHYFKNPGKRPAQILCVSTPATL